MVAAFVIVVSLGVLGYLFATTTDTDAAALDRAEALLPDRADPKEDAAREREAAMKQAGEFLLRLYTYGPDDLDAQQKMPAYAERMYEVMTPKLRAAFDEEGLPLAEKSVAAAGYERSGELYATGVLAIDADSATVLSAGTISASFTDPRRPRQRVAQEPRPFRYSLDLVKVDGTWLVDSYTPVTGIQTDPITPSQTPSPSAAPTTPAPSPSARPTTRRPNGAATDRPRRQRGAGQAGQGARS